MQTAPSSCSTRLWAIRAYTQQWYKSCVLACATPCLQAESVKVWLQVVLLVHVLTCKRASQHLRRHACFFLNISWPCPFLQKGMPRISQTQTTHCHLRLPFPARGIGTAMAGAAMAIPLFVLHFSFSLRCSPK